MKNGTIVTEVNCNPFEKLELVPHSQTNYLFYSISPPLPSFLQFDRYTGIIHGTCIQPTSSNRFVIQGENSMTVVNTVLHISVQGPANTTVIGGTIEGRHATVTVEEK